jgi:AcrR family transcriptional regulator
VRGLLIEAAAKVFKDKGFANATIGDIVAEAGVSKSVFYRNFRTKEAIFRASALEPFVAFIEDFRPQYDAANQERKWSAETLLELEKELLRGLDKHMRANKDVLERLASFDMEISPREISLMRRRFDAFFGEMHSWGEKESAIWRPPPNLELTDRVIICLVAGMVLFDKWFMPHGENKVGKDDLIDHVGRLLLYGMSAMGSSMEGLPTPTA